MKKIVLVLAMILLLTGCNAVKDNMTIDYDKYMNNLLSSNENSEYVPCDIEITYDKISDTQYSYQIVIDNPKEDMRNINIVVSHNMETHDGYPSIGVFDEEPINLMVERTEDDTNKGIVLVGYIDYNGDKDDFHPEVKLLINYINSAIEEKTIYYKKTI